MQQNIVFRYLIWHFFDMPKNILRAWRDYLRFNLNYFSVPLLLKTLFSPWRKYQVSYGKGFDAGRYLEAFFSNLIFRIFGGIIRAFLIIIGLISEVVVVFGGAIAFFAWLVLPALIVLGLFWGFKIIF